MLIRIFRSTGFLPPVLLAVLTGLMWAISLSGTYSIIPPNGMPFYDAVCSLLAVLPAWAGAVVGGLLHYTQAIHLNLVLNKHEVHFKRSWLPALTYVVLGGLLPPYLWIHPGLFTASLLILALDLVFQFYKNRQALSLIFHTGFLLGLSSLFYLPAVVLVLFFFLSLLILRPFSWREWAVGFMGIAIPFYLAFTVYFLLDRLPGLYEDIFITGIKRQIELGRLFVREYVPSLSWAAVLLLLSFANVRSNYLRNVTKTRLIQQLLFLLIPILFFAAILSKDDLPYRFQLMAVPISVYVSYYFLVGKKMWLMETAFLLLLAGWAYNFFMVH